MSSQINKIYNTFVDPPMKNQYLRGYPKFQKDPKTLMESNTQSCYNVGMFDVVGKGPFRHKYETK